MGVIGGDGEGRWEEARPCTQGRPRETWITQGDPMHGSDRKRRRRSGLWTRCRAGHFMRLCLLVLFILSSAEAAFINFDNCLENSIIANPSQLQFVPLFLSVKYDTAAGPNPLNITVYGNVTGTSTGAAAPPPDSPDWNNPNATDGKILNIVQSNNHYTTLFTSLSMLSFTPIYNPSQFCQSVSQGSCPLGPVFNVNGSNPAELRAFSIEHDLQSSYRFASVVPTLRVRSGDSSATDLACISATITPDLGSTLRGLVAFFPLLILLFIAVANILAATYSPWGSPDVFRWTSNYGRDEDLLRLVTPGFADCLQYIQFITLTGALNLAYPGFYQPIVAQGAWSALMFNQSFVSAESGTNPVTDGVYTVNGTYGLDRYRQYVGLTANQDIWPGMVVWLLVILAAVTALTQLALGTGWLYHKLASVPEEDLRSKNVPFTVGNLIRIIFNFLLLPIISLSMFQLVIAAHSPAYSVALAVVLILVLLGFAFWMVRLIVTTRPRAYLFDDLPTVLLYGPVYNTYSDDAAPFSLVPMFITLIRGIAIGALQPAGIAQIVVLAICEVVLVLTLTAFQPYPPPTSMNLYQGLFALVRFLVLLLSVTFVPALGVSEQTRGWIGYAILLLHAIVLVFGFFLNALQTMLEVFARLAGAGGADGGVTRGGLTKVFGARQLSRRNPRSSHASRQSMASDAAMLSNIDERSTQFGGSRARSLSGSSAFLLNRTAASDGRASVAFDAGSAQGGTHSRADSSGMYTPTTPGANSAFSHPKGYQPMAAGPPKSGSVIGFKPEPFDPYYRPPRPRARTLEAQQSGDGENTPAGPSGDAEPAVVGAATAGHPLPAYLGTARDDPDLEDSRPARKDYAVREVDFYYRVRGPALSHRVTRKLKTGPADPTGPVSSASGWFHRLLGGKTKEQGKGFEVVRSSRAPPPGLFPPAEGDEYHEPYRDDPDAPASEEAAGGHSRQISAVTASSYHDSEGDDTAREEDHDAEDTAEYAPQLPQIDAGGSIELPSRIGSRSSTNPPRRPTVPKKSSRRHTPSHSTDDSNPALESTTGSPGSVARSQGTQGSEMLHPSDQQAGRLPFTSSESGSRVSEGRTGSVASTASTIQRAVSNEQGTPSGLGFVVHHRAGASIHQAPGDHPITGSTAELVEQGTDSDSAQ